MKRSGGSSRAPTHSRKLACQLTQKLVPITGWLTHTMGRLPAQWPRPMTQHGVVHGVGGGGAPNSQVSLRKKEDRKPPNRTDSCRAES